MTVPPSTYRLQFGPEFRLADAIDLTDYLVDLGVGALYASPLLAATPGSTHGYDLVDPTRVDATRGGEVERSALAARLRTAGLGFVLDVVCNHMGVADAPVNSWWWDVLRHGPGSRYAHYFDIDWAAGPLLLPVLADDGAAAGPDLKVVDDQLVYHEHRFPLAPGTGDGPVAAVHERQHYRLVSWRRGAAELTYRRFFNIDTLACLRTEDPEVFAALHDEVLRWVRGGEVTGLRIDHPDGLADPTGYLRRLRAAAPDTWIVVEKVLAAAEELPTGWPVDGTTGYDALGEICGVFVDGRAEGALAAAAGPAAGDLAEVVRAARRQVVTTMLVAETRRVEEAVAALLPACPPARRAAAVRALLVEFPVYRSYLPLHRWALDEAVERVVAADPTLADVCRAVRDEMVRHPEGTLARRLQQATGAVMAKGVEDTALYRHSVLVARNEVGVHPDRFAVTPARLHQANLHREAAWPATMTTLSTHDTKRSEDVRARLAVLSELADEYVECTARWSRRQPVGDPLLEPLAWQTLLGAWPIGADRLSAYLLKAVRETRLRTDWLNPDRDYEDLVTGWPSRVLEDGQLVGEVREFVRRITGPGRVNSLGQKLLQLAGPGVPDVYQGTELWDGSLVDPDNRRPVDFAVRRTLLARLDAGWLPAVDDSGAAKLLVTARTLRLRRDQPELFRGYRPLRAEGAAGDHLVGFARGDRDAGVVAVATRLPVGLTARGGWGDTVLPLPDDAGRGWRNVLTGARVDSAAPPVGELLARLPVALLVREGKR